MKVFALIALLVAIAAGIHVPQQYRKRLNGPVSANPTAVPDAPFNVASGSLTPINVVGGEVEVELEIKACSKATVMIAAPSLDYDVLIKGPYSDEYASLDAVSQDPFSYEFEVSNESFGINEQSAPSRTFELLQPIEGSYKMKVVTRDGAKVDAKAILGLIEEPRDYHLVTNYENVTSFKVGDSVRVMAKIVRGGNTHSTNFGEKEQHAKDVSSKGYVRVTTPSGEDLDYPFLQTSAGLVAEIPIGAPGIHNVHTVMSSIIDGDETPFLRSHHDTFNARKAGLQLLADHVLLTEEAELNAPADAPLAFHFKVPVSAPASTSPEYVNAYARVVDATGEPVAYISGMYDVVTDEHGEASVTLPLHRHWADRTSAVMPLAVEELVFRCPDTSYPLVHKPEPLRTVVPTPLQYTVDSSVSEVAEVPFHVHSGYAPAIPFGRTAAFNTVEAEASEGKIVLVHGYCSATNPFPLEHFTNAVQFEDFTANRSNDEFAKLVLEFAKDIPSFSTVSHSQGGLVTLHLYTFYHSGLDAAKSTEGRLLQSVGSPYQGCSAAGGLATIGKIVSIGCGACTDLTVSGAAAWLATIPMDKRISYFHTTQYKKKFLGISFCNLGSNIILSKPNDGTAEHKYSELPGGNKVEHIEGWCHSENMHHPPQTGDENRNKEMNSEAAR